MMIRSIIKVAVPVLIIIAALAVVAWQMNSKPVPRTIQAKKITPIVRTDYVELVENYRYQVAGYGAVAAAGEVNIVSEVSGKIIWVSDKMKTGGMFRKGEPLYRIDDTDYVAALDSSLSALRNAEYELKKVEEEAGVSLKEWEMWNSSPGQKDEPGELIAYGPQLAASRAAVKDAESAVVSARSDLAKVVYKAPFDSIVTEESIEYGKVINNGESAGTLVRTDRYEINLPMAAKDAVRIRFSEDTELASDGYVELAEGEYNWKWDIYAERILPDADSSTGMLQAILVVSDPFDTREGARPILPIGANVRAVVKDHREQTMVRIPDQALHEGTVVWVLSDDNKVQIRDVKVVEVRGDYIYIGEGLSAGEEIIISDLEGILDGMPVRTTGGKTADKGAQDRPDVKQPGGDV
ncbi:efflux transporter, RND family, MFP subunit [Denitrovibrio acetiphilus DSM 12809]|uniref:Efflux transporter, RND family, MFP subunit n=1 Tax=Denitrovibrio acetiphilus (strain DSM 12809 / NBRC 114555 / N2460) TaxID=522772 RepID=D4H5E2_DENA2|nr:efflux RND transporter periplasmic adaptor subunit [Denitrovibrio acetiphilus]ADD67562.1 efflux transporter, RND family, MFP subunit [Denitrovibrio acetiphilus DSM 12809]